MSPHYSKNTKTKSIQVVLFKGAIVPEPQHSTARDGIAPVTGVGFFDETADLPFSIRLLLFLACGF